MKQGQEDQTGEEEFQKAELVKPHGGPVKSPHRTPPSPHLNTPNISGNKISHKHHFSFYNWNQWQQWYGIGSMVHNGSVGPSCILLIMSSAATQCIDSLLFVRWERCEAWYQWDQSSDLMRCSVSSCNLQAPGDHQYNYLWGESQAQLHFHWPSAVKH